MGKERIGLRWALWIVVCWALVAGGAGKVHAFSAGITTGSFGPSGCNQCHAGGSVPTVTLTGPTIVAPSSINEYTLEIVEIGAQNRGGLNVSGTGGTFSTGGGSSAQTQLLSGEITHSSPKLASLGLVTFSFLWTAPSSFSTATLNAWGNAVNGNNLSSGDAASMQSLLITSTDPETPTPTATLTPTPNPGTPTPTPTPTPTSTPNLSCSDEDPLKPYLIADVGVRRCQHGIAKAAFLYTRGRFKAVQRCLKKFHKGDLTGDPVLVCHGTVSTPPTDFISAAQISAAEMKAGAQIDARCTDPAVAPIDTCADTVAGVKTCLVAEHFQLVENALDAEYGMLVASSDHGEQNCQKGLSRAGGKYVSRAMRAIQKCLNKRNKQCATGDAAALCMGALVGGTRVPPADGKTADKLARAETKLLKAINSRCTDAQVAALDACGDTRTALGACLSCTHWTAAVEGIESEYGGANRFADPSTTIQTVVDAADPGDTIMLDPGDYSEAVLIATDGLTFKGQKTCTGERAVNVNPGASPNGFFASGVDNLTFEGFEVNDFEENDIFIADADGVTFRDMITRGPGTASGTEYGIFPVLSSNVLIEDCLVTGVRDAGIYVGQSINIVVRNNEVHGNVAGIEIENSANAEVHDNFAHDNTGGILVFKLAELPVQLSDCHDIHDNVVQNNNIPNFGSGLVGIVPQGTGILILSNDAGHFHDNQITGNDSFGIAVVDQDILNLLFNPDPFPVLSPDYTVDDNIFTGNTITGNGQDPDPGVPVSGDVIVFLSPWTGNCASGNTFTSGGFTGFPSCSLPEPPGCPIPAFFEEGDFTTYTQDGWGEVANGSNAGQILLDNFAAVYASGVEVGIPGAGGNSMQFSSATSISDYLPASDPPSALSADLIDPTSSDSGELGGHVLALQINVDFSAAGVTQGPGGPFGELELANTGGSLDGETVADILAAANTALGGGSLPAGYTFATLNDLLANLNASFDAGVLTTWALEHLEPPLVW